MMAAICFEAFSLGTNDKKIILEKWKKCGMNCANCGMKAGKCDGKCLLKIQTILDCRTECGEPHFNKMGSFYFSEPDSPCVCMCWVKGRNKCRKECMGDCGVEVFNGYISSKREKLCQQQNNISN